MSHQLEQGITFGASIFASVTGSVLMLTLNDIDVASRLLLTWLTIASVALIIGVNWRKGIEGLKDLFKKGKK